MFNFPCLKSLVIKNGQCTSRFPRTMHWYSQYSKPKQQQQIESVKSIEKQQDEYTKVKNENEGKVLHWKKAVKSRYEIERVKTRTLSIGELGDLNWLKNWDFEESILRGKTYHPSESSSSVIECKMCDETFPSRRLLGQHKRLEHFPSWEGGNKEFCYVPYFVEPKRFNLLRGTLTSGQLECTLCQNWLGESRVKQLVGSYLEGLRTKIKEKAGDKFEMTTNTSGVIKTNKRVRKCKSMSRRVCELCSKILSNRKGLERHMLIHTGEKPFPCDTCGKPFRRKDNCVRHKKTAHLFKKPRKPRRRKVVVDKSGSNCATTQRLGSLSQI